MMQISREKVARTCNQLVVLLVFILSSASASVAQSSPVDIRLNPLKGTVATEFILAISVEAAEGQEVPPPSFPETEQFAIRLEQQGEQTTIINGELSRSWHFVFHVYPNQSLAPGKYGLPDFVIRVGSKEIPVKGPQLTITANEEDTEQSADRFGVTFRQSVDTTKPYVGQQITYRAKILSSENFVTGELSELNVENMLRERLGKEEQRARQIGRRRLTVVSEVLIPTAAGASRIPERILTAKLRDSRRVPSRPRSPFGGSIFDFDPFDSPLRPTTITRRMSAPAIALDVRPLPPAPNGITEYIPVGALQATATASAETVAVGESISLHIEIFGRGNLRPYQLPAPVSPLDGMKRYDDQPQLTTSVRADKIVYRKKFTLALVPTKPGELQLPQFPITYFDPLQSRYQTVTTDAISVKVTGTAMEEPEEQVQTAGIEDTEDSRLLGQDIFPQKEGEDLFRPHVPRSRSWTILVLLGIPTVFALLRLLVLNLVTRKDPSRRAQLQARERAELVLANTSCTSDMAWDALREYLHWTFAVDVQDAALDRFRNSLTAANVSESTAAEFQKALRTLEIARFSGAAGQALPEEIRENLRMNVSRCEQEREASSQKKSQIAGPLAAKMLVVAIGIHTAFALFFSQASFASELVDEQVRQANAAYRNANYFRAIELYTFARTHGLDNAALRYNLANSYFRSGEIGEAILEYRRALQLKPRDPEIRANLSFVRKESGQRLDTPPAVSYQWLRTTFSDGELDFIFFLSYSLFWCVTLLAGPLQIKGRQLVLLAALASTAISGFSLFFLADDSSGQWRIALPFTSPGEPLVVTAANAVARSGDGESFSAVFALKEGDELLGLEERNNWIKVELPLDNSLNSTETSGNAQQQTSRVGWIPRDSIEFVDLSPTRLVSLTEK